MMPKRRLSSKSHVTRICRVTWPLLSQYVFFVAIEGSSIAGWTLPPASIARDVTVCSPGAGDQSKCQARHAKSDLLSSSVAFIQDPLSILTSTAAIGAGPHTMPSIRKRPFWDVTLAGADFSNMRPTDVSVTVLV